MNPIKEVPEKKALNKRSSQRKSTKALVELMPMFVTATNPV